MRLWDYTESHVTVEGATARGYLNVSCGRPGWHARRDFRRRDPHRRRAARLTGNGDWLLFSLPSANDSLTA